MTSLLDCSTWSWSWGLNLLPVDITTLLTLSNHQSARPVLWMQHVWQNSSCPFLQIVCFAKNTNQSLIFTSYLTSLSSGQHSANKCLCIWTPHAFWLTLFSLLIHIIVLFSLTTHNKKHSITQLRSMPIFLLKLLNPSPCFMFWLCLPEILTSATAISA